MLVISLPYPALFHSPLVRLVGLARFDGHSMISSACNQTAYGDTMFYDD